MMLNYHNLSRTHGLNRGKLRLSYNLINLSHFTMPYLADGTWASSYYSRYASPYWRSRYYDPLPYSYAGYSSYSSYLDAKYARPLPALAPVSTVTYSSPLKTEVVTESPGKREVTTYDYSPSTAYTYASPVRSAYYDYPRYYDSPYSYSRYYDSPYARSYVSPYTGSLI